MPLHAWLPPIYPRMSAQMLPSLELVPTSTQAVLCTTLYDFIVFLSFYKTADSCVYLQCRKHLIHNDVPTVCLVLGVQLKYRLIVYLQGDPSGPVSWCAVQHQRVCWGPTQFGMWILMFPFGDFHVFYSLWSLATPWRQVFCQLTWHP